MAIYSKRGGRVWRGAGVLIVGVGVQRLVAATDSSAATDRLKTWSISSSVV